MGRPPAVSKPKSPPRKPRAVLMDWYFKFERPRSWTVQLVGKDASRMNKNNQEIDIFTTSAIDRRIDSHHLATNSGSLYELKGPSDAHELKRLHFDGKLISSFSHGFPSNWQHLLEAEFHRRTGIERTSARLLEKEPVPKTLKKLPLITRNSIANTAYKPRGLVRCKPAAIDKKKSKLNKGPLKPEQRAVREKGGASKAEVGKKPRRKMTGPLASGSALRLRNTGPTLSALRRSAQKAQNTVAILEAKNAAFNALSPKAVKYLGSKSGKGVHFSPQRLELASPVEEDVVIPVSTSAAFLAATSSPAKDELKGVASRSSPRLSPKKPESTTVPSPVSAASPLKQPSTPSTFFAATSPPAKDESKSIVNRSSPRLSAKEPVAFTTVPLPVPAASARKQPSSPSVFNNSRSSGKKITSPIADPVQQSVSTPGPVRAPPSNSLRSPKRKIATPMPAAIPKRRNAMNFKATIQQGLDVQSAASGSKSSDFSFSLFDGQYDDVSGPLSECKWPVEEDEDKFVPRVMTDTTKAMRFSIQPRHVVTPRKDPYEPANATKAKDNMIFQGMLLMEKKWKSARELAGGSSRTWLPQSIPKIPEEPEEYDRVYNFGSLD